MSGIGGTRSSARQVTLYSKPDCHLCEDARVTLERLRQRYPHALKLVDITTDPLLMQRFGKRIPVLEVGDHQYSAPLSPAVLERALREATS